jgi:hypothetical protein
MRSEVVDGLLESWAWEKRKNVVLEARIKELRDREDDLSAAVRALTIVHACLDGTCIECQTTCPCRTARALLPQPKG